MAVIAKTQVTLARVDNGPKGDPGNSASIEVTKEGNTTTVVATSGDGTVTSEDIYDGSDGISAVSRDGNTITITDAEGTDITVIDGAEAISQIDDILIYDHDYEIVNGYANFTAHLYRAGKEVTSQYDPLDFSWYLKTESTNDKSFLGNGVTISIPMSRVGYGAEVVGRYSSNDDSEALSTDGDNLTDDENSPITVRATGESVRVRDLETTTTIYDTEKVMIIGAEDEHLVTMRTLFGQMLEDLEGEVLTLYCGTATELVG